MYSEKITKIIQDAQSQVSDIVKNTKSDSRSIIARYTAAVAVNFTDWIGKTTPWARHELAQYALIDNLRCEAEQDHVGMLLKFAEMSDATPTAEDYAYSAKEVADIRKLFANSADAGLIGVTLCAVLENTSELFIPDLAERAKERGCNDLTYTDVHGEADVEHSDAFSKATAAEMTMGYDKPEEKVMNATTKAIELIKKIYS